MHITRLHVKNEMKNGQNPELETKDLRDRKTEDLLSNLEGKTILKETLDVSLKISISMCL